MPGVQVAYPNWAANENGYVDSADGMGNGLRIVSSPVFKAHKPLPRRRHFSDDSANLRSQFNTAEVEHMNITNGDTKASLSPSTPNASTTPSLLPTPPSLQHEFSNYTFDNSSAAETAILRSTIVTPAPQQSPPTPDITPPRNGSSTRIRPFLGTQPSLASTRAESFQTAREDMSSDEEVEDFYPIPNPQPSPRRLQPAASISKERSQIRSSPLARADGNESDNGNGQNGADRHPIWTPTKGTATQVSSEPSMMDDRPSPSPSASREIGQLQVMKNAKRLPNSTTIQARDEDQNNHIAGNNLAQSSLLTPPRSADEEKTELARGDVENGAETTEDAAFGSLGGSPVHDPDSTQLPHRGQSLRERLLESQRLEPSQSTEHFANEIGWSRQSEPFDVAAANDNLDDINVAPLPSSELRNRVNSWRLSGVSTTSTVEAIVVDNEPKRQQTLRHRGRNASLRSASSPITKSNRNSLLSNSDSPHRLLHKRAKLSNQNRSSFGSEVSRSFSIASSTAPQPRPEVIRVAVIPERTSSLHSSANSSKRHSASFSASSGGQGSMIASGRSNSLELNRHRRALSESLPTAMNFSNRGRDRRYPPVVPARSTSLSAPTSRSTSRANSITSEHPENLRSRRVAAEEDVRKTLARMESERTIPLAEGHASPPEPVDTPSAEPETAEPGTALWASLRPTSTQHTPFSQPSMHSSSPVEMGEARAINLFPHNNHSLQIVESNHLPESRAVQELYTSKRDLQVDTNGSNTPQASLLPMLVVDSPLRNPREPPIPPQFKVIPPTPAGLTPTHDDDHQLGMDGPSRKSSKRRFGSLKRPSIATRRHSESFVRSLGRSLSLNVRNKKADQDLDGTLHPFWRPRGFWDDFSESDDEYYDREVEKDGGFVNNSLGMPQKRTIIDGPLSLVRKISDSSRNRRQNRGVSKRSSHGSLSRMRAGRRFHTVPGLGLRFQVMGLRDLQERMLSVKRRREDERREKRRQELRNSIGANVISQGDSRFPARIASVPDAGEGSEYE